MNAILKSFSQKQKAILLVCVAVISLGASISLLSLKTKPISSPPPVSVVPTPAYVAASFSLDPSTGNFKVGDVFTLELILSTGSTAADAVDTILVYDPTIFEAKEIMPGTIFAQYPIKQIDNQKGQVQLSAAAQIENNQVTSFAGQAKFGSIVFRALKETTLEGAQIHFSENSLVAFQGKDALDLAKNLEGQYIVTSQ